MCGLDEFEVALLLALTEGEEGVLDEGAGGGVVEGVHVLAFLDGLAPGGVFALGFVLDY